MPSCKFDPGEPDNIYYTEIYIAITVIPATINTVENNLVNIELVEISSPKAPLQSFVIPILYKTVNNDLVPTTAETKDTGPKDRDQSKVISPTCAVIHSLMITNSKAGLRLENRDLTSVQGSDLEAKDRKINPRVSILKPCVYKRGSSSSASLPVTIPLPVRNAENIKK